MGDKSLVMTWSDLFFFLLPYCLTALFRNIIISVMICDLEVVREVAQFSAKAEIVKINDLTFRGKLLL